MKEKYLNEEKKNIEMCFFGPQIDGTFRVNAPPVLLGYVQESVHGGEMDVGIDRDIKTLLSMFVTIEPPLTQPEPAKERVSTWKLFTLKHLPTLWNECNYNYLQC